jgi:Zn-dependent metalloprotease
MAADKINLRQAPLLLQNLRQMATIQAEDTAPMQQAFGLGQETDVQLLSVTADTAGFTHSRYRQLYRGIPVWGESLVVTKNARREVARLHGTLVSDIAQDVPHITPALAAQEALAAMQDLHLRRFATAHGRSTAATPWA